jgi:hypothetical protein
MICVEDPIILYSDMVEGLPPYYRYAVRHLSQTGRAVIKDDSEKPENKA